MVYADSAGSGTYIVNILSVESVSNVGYSIPKSN